jgi:hypothetical protein
LHDFEWQESDGAITIGCRLPLLRRLVLAVVLLAYLFWVEPWLLSFLWDLRLGSTSPTGGIPWRFVYQAWRDQQVKTSIKPVCFFIKG